MLWRAWGRSAGTRTFLEDSGGMSDEAWFESLGYEVEVTTADGVVWATLRSITRLDFELEGYGRGNTGDPLP